MTYDPEAQAAYLYVKEGYRGHRVTTELVPNEIMLDHAPTGELLRIEIIGMTISRPRAPRGPLIRERLSRASVTPSKREESTG